MTNAPIEILMIEDSQSDVRLTQIALKQGKLINNLHVERDGRAGLDYLKKSEGFEDAIRPDLILLDLNLPKMNGHEVLEAIREDDDLRTIPVVMLTTSDSDQDVLKSYELQANCYITKPVNFEKFIDVVQQIEQFWVNVVKLPAVS